MEWPAHPARFGLTRLSEISGVDLTTIKRWQHRGSLQVWSVGRGVDRAYDLSDALHAAVVAEMTRMGLGITGPGADLSQAIAGWIEYRLREGDAVDGLAPIALVPDPGGWIIERDTARVAGAGSCIVLGLRTIAEGVCRRYVGAEHPVANVGADGGQESREAHHG